MQQCVRQESMPSMANPGAREVALPTSAAPVHARRRQRPGATVGGPARHQQLVTLVRQRHNGSCNGGKDGGGMFDRQPGLCSVAQIVLQAADRLQRRTTLCHIWCVEITSNSDRTTALHQPLTGPEGRGGGVHLRPALRRLRQRLLALQPVVDPRLARPAVLHGRWGRGPLKKGWSGLVW